MSTYLFDFDGTLGDSMPFFAEGILAILKKYRIAYPEDLVKIVTPLGYAGTARYCIEMLGTPLTVESFVEELKDYLFPAYRDAVSLKPGVADYLKALRREGHSLNLLSASPRKMTATALQRCGVIDLFDNVWSCEDFGMGKDNPQIFVAAAQRAGGVIADTVLFDDNLQVIKTAAKAGIQTVGVYDASSADYTEQIKEVTDRFIYTFEDLTGGLQ